MAADYVVVPLSPDLFSLQGLKNLGPTLRHWRKEWTARLGQNPAKDLRLPSEKMQPIGYVVLQYNTHKNNPVKAYKRWIDQIPIIYREEVLEDDTPLKGGITKDVNRIILIKHYQSLMPMAQEAHKPIFFLKPADGAIGAHQKSIQSAYKDFQTLAQKIAKVTNISY